jgi:putative ABC transport system ATP-binding protein
VTNGEAIVSARTLSRSYGHGAAERRAVNNVDLEVHAGEVVLVVGPSGCGKSTLLALLGGLDRDYEGRLELFGRDVSHMSDRELSRLRGRRIGFVFQSFHLLPHLTAVDNVAAPSLFSGEALDREHTARRGREVLEQVGLSDRANALPSELSGGQRQRVALARALWSGPELLLCDEPTGNLDRDTGAQIIDLFGKLHDRLGATFVIVTHEERLTRVATRTLHMLDGRLAEGGQIA